MENMLKKILIIELVSGIKISKENGGVWCTSDPRLHIIADDWLNKGWLVETTNKHFSPDDKDRSFDLTDTGMKETSWLMVA